MITKSLVLSESIFVYLRYWNKERRHSGLQASMEETEREERKI